MTYLPVKLEVATPPVKLEVAAPEFDVCGICRCAECDGLSCDPYEFIQSPSCFSLPVKLEVAV